MRIKVVLQAYVQTAYEQYTHMFKTVEIEMPDDGQEWHVAGEEWIGGRRESENAGEKQQREAAEQDAWESM